tara:strand:+ start:71 stop:349 length:279 start_codon:yes stop_codon:yes gene_type:complete
MTPDTQLFWDKESGMILSQKEWGVKFYEIELEYVGLAKDNGYEFDNTEWYIDEWNNLSPECKICNKKFNGDYHEEEIKRHLEQEHYIEDLEQ